MKSLSVYIKAIIVNLTIIAFLAVSGAYGEWIYQEDPDKKYTSDHPLQGFHYYVTYHKPSGAIAANWKVKHGNYASYEEQIPSNCWNVDSEKLILRLYSNSNDGAGRAVSWPECFNGTDWDQIGKVAIENFGGSGTDSTPESMTDGNWGTYSVWNEIGPYNSKWQTDYSKTAPRWYEEAILWFVGDTSGCPSGMVSYWKFDDSADPDKDHYGNNHGIAIVNADWYSEGLIGGAMRFYGTSYEGADSYIDIGADSGLDMQNLSIATWIKSDKPQQYWGCYISHCEPGYDDGWSAWWGCCASGEDRQNKILWGVQGVEGYSGDTHLDTNWHFVVVTNDIADDIRRIYVDGQLDGTDFAYEYENNGSVRIGQDTCYAERFSGWLDEMAIFNRALTATEIQQMYQSGLAGKGYCEAVNQPPTAMEIVNGMVGFTPMRPYATISFTKDYPPSKCSCRDSDDVLFYFWARIKNTSNNSLTNLTVRVNTLTNNNLFILGTDHLPPIAFIGAETGGEGVLWTLPKTSGYYVDGVLAPGEIAYPLFGICLDEIKPFYFWVDFLGTVR